PFITPATNGVTALCLEPHDLWISKAVAGRPKDMEFCKALIERNIVEVKTLRQRLEKIETLNPAIEKQVSSLIPDA
ncbi:MAG: hypothetical protein O6703_11855, partial [Gammaproteobacteria bacterium]|nr:hypothetical protein [Gammaproteobacteria bacterium]